MTSNFVFESDSKGPKNAMCLWVRLRKIEQRQVRIVQHIQFFLVSAKDKLHF